jgi:hypothetical protein
MNAEVEYTDEYTDKLINITGKVRELHGHTKNFYAHIPGCYNNMFTMTLKEHRGKTILIIDMYGQNLKIINTVENKVIVL